MDNCGKRRNIRLNGGDKLAPRSTEDGRAALLASARGLAMAYPGEAAQAGVSRSA